MAEGAPPQKRKEEEARGAGDGVDKSFDRDHEQRISLHLLCRFTHMRGKVHEGELKEKADKEPGKRDEDTED
jgi:hypothetical protein